MCRKGVNTLVFKTNATLCYAEKSIPVFNVNTSDEAADVIHIINYNSHVSLMNIRICFSPFCTIRYHISRINANAYNNRKIINCTHWKIGKQMSKLM